LKKEKGLCNEKQMSFDDFLINSFKIKLEDLSLNLSKYGTGKPLILYSSLLDEGSDEYGEQELAVINESYVVIQVISFGGFVPLAVQHQRVFTFEEFSLWIFKRSGSLFIQCLQTIDEALLSFNS
jgi:hypothetical protein